MKQDMEQLHSTTEILSDAVKITSGQPVLMHSAVTQECGSLLPRNTV